MTSPSAPSAGRPRRRDVAAGYDLGVDAYVSLWSPVILPPARELIRRLDLGDSRRVLDVGAGTGALIPSIRDHAPHATVIALDASAGMLRVARAHAAAPAVQADAMALPIAGATVDAIVLAYVLFHLGDPGAALVDAARVLVPGARVGTITWSREAVTTAHAIWEDTLAAGGVPPSPPRRNDTGLAAADALAERLAAAGLRPKDVWRAQLSHQWNPDTFWRLVTGSGQNRLRLDGVDDQTRQSVLTLARRRLASLGPDDYEWTGEVTCLIAVKPA
jgi:SAM-dependent methyltransferase